LKPVKRANIDRKDVDREVARFEKALASSFEELHALRDRVQAEIGEAESGIFEAHLALLQDQEFIKAVKQRLHSELINVEPAVADEIIRLEHLLMAVKSEYIKERSQDIRDVGKRLLIHLERRGARREDLLAKLPPRSVVVAHELLPSDTLKLDRAHVAGIITESENCLWVDCCI